MGSVTQNLDHFHGILSYRRTKGRGRTVFYEGWRTKGRGKTVFYEGWHTKGAQEAQGDHGRRQGGPRTPVGASRGAGVFKP